MVEIGIHISKSNRETWGGTVDRPGCGWGSSKTDFKLMECDPRFLGPESSSQGPVANSAEQRVESSSGSVASGLVFDQRSKE
jgi:hypothetical protein